MSDLVCRPSIVPPAPTAAEPMIASDGFFPDVDPNRLRLQIKVRETVTPDRLREAVLGAIITVDNDTGIWRLAHEIAGYPRLADVPALSVGGESRLLVLYRRAIGCLVKAELVERNRDVDQTGAGQRDASELEPSIDELRRDARHAIRDLMGRPRTTIDLI